MEPPRRHRLGHALVVVLALGATPELTATHAGANAHGMITIWGKLVRLD